MIFSRILLRYFWGGASMHNVSMLVFMKLSLSKAVFASIRNFTSLSRPRHLHRTSLVALFINYIFLFYITEKIRTEQFLLLQFIIYKICMYCLDHDYFLCMLLYWNSPDLLIIFKTLYPYDRRDFWWLTTARSGTLLGTWAWAR